MRKVLKYTFKHGEEHLSQLADFSLLTTSLADCKVFTTCTSIEFSSSEIFFPFIERHLSRLFSSAEYLDIYRPEILEHGKSFIKDKLLKTSVEFSKECSDRIMMRIVLDIDGCEFYFTGSDKAWLPKEPVKLNFLKIEREVPGHKTSLLDPCKEASKFAEKKGFNDAILVNETGQVKETAWANLYWSKDGLSLTTVKEGALPGIMQEVLLTHPEVSEGEMTLEQLLEGNKPVFISNSTIGIRPVNQIADVKLPLDSEMLKTFQNYIDSNARE